MLPYAQRVLDNNSECQKESTNDHEENVDTSNKLTSNWAVFSTALLLKSRLDHERQRTIDRAVLQLKVT